MLALTQRRTRPFIHVVNDNANLGNDKPQIISQERSSRLFGHGLVNMIVNTFVSSTGTCSISTRTRTHRRCTLFRRVSPKVRSCSGSDSKNGSMRLALVGPMSYIDFLLESHGENSEMVSQSFKSQAGFAASPDNACQQLLSGNAATRTLSTESLELIAQQVGMLLRKTIRWWKREISRAPQTER
ncbi:hypothetical protein BKA70DRAFT_1304949 [Coprinopsis sp. MPI-PUGE-AT-0042]|nr:hypothetical protein BKA70DRAFT_1304949 [Coprinopsis sp. MPI-PUGE-AT-0042]